MNTNHKVTILALSLSVLTLATISTLLSLNQSGVLGVTTSPTPYPRPTTTPTLNVTAPSPERGIPCNTFKTVFSMANTTNPIYSQLSYLLKNFCPSTTIPMATPSVSVCKTGVSNLTFGQTCTFNNVNTTSSHNSAKVTCYDGSTSTIGDNTNKVCYQNFTLEALAIKYCEGKSACNRTTPTLRPSAYPTKISQITGTEVKCGWCGTTCTFIKPGMMCPMIATQSGQQCVTTGNRCTIVYSTDPQPVNQ